MKKTPILIILICYGRFLFVNVSQIYQLEKYFITSSVFSYLRTLLAVSEGSEATAF